MSMTLPPPGQRPDTVQKLPAPSAKTSRDFAHHVAPKNDTPSPAKEAVHEPAQDAVLATERLLAAKSIVTPLTEAAGGAVLYPQSLRVVGYLSMLGDESTSVDGFGAVSNRPLAMNATASQVSAPGMDQVTERPAQALAGLVGGVSPSGALATMTNDAQEATTPEATAAAAVPSDRRYARRFIRIHGDSLLLRDFSLAPEHAKAVLDAFRTLSAGQGHALTRALVNGKPYLLDKKDDHVG